MAVKIDQELLFKYVDKGFLALAGIFLLVAAALTFMGEQRVPIKYSRVQQAFQTAKDRQATAHQRIEELLKDDAALTLVQSSPSYYDAVRLAQRPEALPPVWADRDRWAPYRAIQPPPKVERYFLRVPLLVEGDPQKNQRVAAKDLKLWQDKGYLSTTREKEGLMGRDTVYVTGQFTVDVAQQLQWCREAARVDMNPGWQNRINDIRISDYEVQRSEQRPDGTWTEWRTRRTVRYEDSRRQQLPIRRMQDGDPNVLYKDERAGKKAEEDFAALRADLQKYQNELLRPPFYQMLGKEWMQPYEMRKEAPVAPGALPGAVPGVPGVVPGVPPLVPGVPPGVPAMELPPEIRPVARGQQVELWFNDEVDPNNDIGKTFRYRVRIKFLNPIFGAKADEIDPKHAQEAWLVELPGAWGEPSERVTVEPLVRFFFVGRLGDRTNFVLFRWIFGVWHEARAEFTIGDSIAMERNEEVEIPGTGGLKQKLSFRRQVTYNAGVTAVDAFDTRIRHPDIERSSAKLVYYDQLANQLGVRFSLIDTDESIRFRNETRRGEPLPTRRPPVPEEPVGPEPLPPWPTEPQPPWPMEPQPGRPYQPGPEMAPPPGQ